MNQYNYIRVDTLQPVSIESLAILVTLVYFLFLAFRRQLTLEVVYFLALPFSDNPFRIASSMQPVEAVAILLVALNYRRVRLNYLILAGLLFVLYSLIGYVLGNVQDTFSLFYSFKFLLIGMVFSILTKRAFALPVLVMRFAVALAFLLTLLQIVLWLAGLPIHGIFFQGFFPRAKGLAHEPATWSIYILMLFPFILHFKLGRAYLLMNIATLVMTLSTFGIVSALSFAAIRWALSLRSVRPFRPRVFRVKKKRLLLLAVSVAALGVLMLAVPGLADSAAKLVSVFDKLAQYQQEFAQGLSGGTRYTPQNDTSGRGLDFTYFRETFPQHWLVGIGSFNAPYTDQSQISGTNFYMITPVELGVTGSAVLIFLLSLHYGVLLRNRQSKSVDFLAGSLNLLLMIAGIRCFGFSEVWYVQAAVLRTVQAPAANDKQPDAGDLEETGIQSCTSA